MACSILGVLENNEVMYLERAEPYSSLRLYTQIGKREPLYCTALGKILMAALPEKECDHIAEQLDYTPYTPNSASGFEELKKEILFAREHGYAVDREEHTLGSSCLAMPVYDYTGNVAAALSISRVGLFERYSEQDIYEKMYEAASRLSRRMGYTAPLPRRITGARRDGDRT